MTQQQFVDSINRLMNMAINPIKNEAQSLVNAYMEVSTAKVVEETLNGNGELKEPLAKDSADASTD